MTDNELQQKRLMAAAVDVAVATGILVAFWSINGAIAAGTKTVVGDSIGTGAVAYLPRLVSLVGAALGLGYVLLRDVVFDGQSLGKKLQGLRVETLAGLAPSALDSAKRNAVFAVGPLLNVLSSVLALIPCLDAAAACLLWPLIVLGSVATLAIVVVEVMKIVQEPDGLRLGDQFARTRVVEA
jgi:uncharacterized RDD family membrane protein YckC